MFGYAGHDPINGIDLNGLDYLQVQYNSRSNVGSGVVIWFTDDHQPINVYQATTGTKTLEPIPGGLFWGKLLRIRDDHDGMICPQVGFSLNLESEQGPVTYLKTKRTLLRIHPDGNRPGTAGCVGIACRDALRLYNDLNNYLEFGLSPGQQSKNKGQSKSGIPVLVEPN